MKFEIEVESMPDGFRPVAYRPVEKGDWFLGSRGEVIKSIFGHSAPWLILEKIDQGEEIKDINEVRGARLKKLEQDVSGLRESCLKLANRLVATEEAQSLHMDGVAKRLENAEQEISKLRVQVDNMEKIKEDQDRRLAEPQPEPKKPQPYGLWNLEGGNWHSESPFESAGDASRYAAKTLYADWRNYWRVYPYPEDGGKPVELREEKWGLWGQGRGMNAPRWMLLDGDGPRIYSQQEAADREFTLSKVDSKSVPVPWKAYPYPADGGMPMELREGKKQPTSEQFWEYLIRNGWQPRIGGYWVHASATRSLDGRVTFGKPRWELGDYIAEIALVEGKDADQVLAEMLSVSFDTPTGTVARDFHGKPLKQKQIDRPTVYYVRNKTTGNFLRRVDQKDRNTLFVTEDQALAEHMAQGTEGGPYEVYPVTLGE